MCSQPVKREAAAIDDSRRAKALDDARLLHYPPEVPPDMVSRAERVAINQFVELWLEEIPDEEALMRKAMRERAKDANGNYAIHCSKITYSSSNQKIQEWECMYVCFTNKRTLIVDASSMQSFGAKQRLTQVLLLARPLPVACLQCAHGSVHCVWYRYRLTTLGQPTHRRSSCRTQAAPTSVLARFSRPG